jgi:RNA polymerase sigma factor (sigma-70 family)
MKTAPDLILSDEQLVNAYLNGSNGSLGILYERYYTKVYHQCLSFARNQEDAFDLAQDVLIKAFGNLSKFGGKSRFSTWLFSITRNHCISHASRSNRTGMENFGSHYEHLADYAEGEGEEERIRREELELNLNEYLDQLPANDRKMLELKYLYNYSVKDLQQEFILSASAIKMRLLRARNRIEQLHRARYAA